MHDDVGPDEVIFHVGSREEKTVEFGKEGVVQTNVYVLDGELVFKDEVWRR